MCEMSPESNLYRSVTHRGECSTSLFTPSRCCKGRMGEAVAATRQLQYARHWEGPSSSSMPGVRRRSSAASSGDEYREPPKGGE